MQRLKDPLGQGNHVCQGCGKVYAYEQSLIRPVRYECGKPPRFQCPYCNACRRQKTNIMNHIKKKHQNFKIYAIDILTKVITKPTKRMGNRLLM